MIVSCLDFSFRPVVLFSSLGELGDWLSKVCCSLDNFVLKRLVSWLFRPVFHFFFDFVDFDCGNFKFFSFLWFLFDASSLDRNLLAVLDERCFVDKFDGFLATKKKSHIVNSLIVIACCYRFNIHKLYLALNQLRQLFSNELEKLLTN
jgi:hypothetical protein